MKRSLLFLILFLFFISSPIHAQISQAPNVIPCSDCSWLTFYGILCHDTDDGKLYKWNGATQVELAAGGSGDMTQAAYDVDTDDKIDAAAGGTDIDTSGSTGTPYVTAGVWSVENAATMRTSLGLVIGTNVQAYDADLTDFPTQTGQSGKYLTTNGTALSWDAPAGSGDVIGPASSTDNAISRFDSTTGKLLQNSVGILDDSGNLSGIGTIDAGAGGFSVDADGDVTGKSLTITKQSGIAGDVGLYEANSTDTDAAGWRGPASLTGDTSYRGQFPNAKATSGNMVLTWTNSGETGTGTPADPYVQAMSFVDLDNYALTNSIIEPKGGQWDGAGSALSTSSYPGNKVLYVRIPFSGTITKWTVNADQNAGATAVVIDVWKLAYAADTYPTVANTMLATGTKPNIATGGHKTGQANWDGAQSTITAGDWLAFKLDSTSTVTWVQITLDIQR